MGVRIPISSRSLTTAATALTLATRTARNIDYWRNRWSSRTKYTAPARKMTYRRRYRRYRATGRSQGAWNTGPRFQRTLPPRSLRPTLKFAPNEQIGADFTVSQESDQPLVSIPAGDSPSQRDGRIVRLMNLRGQMVFPNGQDTRLVIYTPLDPNDQISLTNTGDVVDPDRFKVWYDNFFHSVGNNRDKQFNLFFGKYGHKIHYDGTASTDTIRGPVRIYQNQPNAAGSSRGHIIASFVDT